MNHFKNLKCEKHTEIELWIKKNIIFDLSATNMLKIIKKHFIFPANGRNTKKYWKSRGWNNGEAYIKCKDFHSKLPKQLSPFSIQFWKNKIDSKTGLYHTLESATYERNCRRPIDKEYWIKRGMPENCAILKAKSVKHTNNIIGSKSGDPATRRITSTASIDYWLNKGFPIEEAKMKQSQRQSTFSIETCILKHGEIKGREIWKERQDKWQATLKSKPQEEIDRINRLKVGSKYSISKAEKEIGEYLKKNNINFISQFRSNGKVYDFCIENKIILEYNGDYWHCNPEIYTNMYKHTRKNKYAHEIWRNDQIRQNCVKDAGYNFLVIWEKDYKENKEKTLEKLLEFIIK